MPSQAAGLWDSQRVSRLNEIEQVHAQVAGGGPGRKWLTQELNRAYVVALASQFQGYCRDLHSEAASRIAQHVPAGVRGVIESNLTLNRALDRGNPNAGNLGADFGRFGLDFWPEVYRSDRRNERRRERLDQVMIWRNAIVHSSAIPGGQQQSVAGTQATMTWARRWRRALAALVPEVDAVVGAHLSGLIGAPPW